MDCVTSEMINAQLNNKQSRIFPFVKYVHWVLAQFSIQIEQKTAPNLVNAL